MARNFVSITTLWGHKLGGINSLNTDLCKQFATKNPIERWRVICLVNRLTNNDLEDAAKHRVTLISLEQFESSENSNPKVSDSVSFEKIEPKKLVEICSVLKAKETIFIGHDVISGDCAIKFSEYFKNNEGRKSVSVVFHHMNYEAYYLNKNEHNLQDGSISFIKKIEDQKRIFKAVDLLYGVGPKLQKSAIEKRRGKDVGTFIPGLPFVEPRNDIRIMNIESFKAITWGRVEIKNDKIKQYSLALASFASTLNDDKEYQLFEQDSRLSIIGVANDETKKWLTEIGGSYYQAEECFNPIHETDTKWIIDNILVDAHVSMMLSTHEGFGLVGLESIAADVPLIISKNSGLFELLKEIFGMDNIDRYICGVRVKGSSDNSINPHDLQSVKEKILLVRNNFESYRDNMIETKKMIEKKYSWKKSISSLTSQFEQKFEDRGIKSVDSGTESVAELTANIAESRRLYIEGLIEKSYEVALTTIKKFPSSSKAFLRLMKAAIRLDRRDVIDQWRAQGLVIKDDNYYAAMVQYEKTFNRDYKAMITYSEKIIKRDTVKYYYELSIAIFYLGIQRYFRQNAKKINSRLSDEAFNALDNLNNALEIAEKTGEEHWWVSVTLLLIYKYLPDYIEEEDWKVNPKETLRSLNQVIESTPLKASARIYRLLLLMIFEDATLPDYVAIDREDIERFPDIFLPVDFMNSVSIRISFLFSKDRLKLNYYNSIIDDYIAMYKKTST